MNLAKKLSIKKNDLVLDIGSGHVPHPRANVIADFYPDKTYDEEQRTGIECVQDKRFVNVDVCDMSIWEKDKFDYVICAQTLNHIDDVGKACQEIMRVGKSGYIEVPTIALDLFEWHPEHFWKCCLYKNKLVFIRKTAKDRNVFGNFFHRLYLENMEFQNLSVIGRESLYIEIEWKKRFDFLVIK